MQAVILAGGLGTRLAEETDAKPKPMVEIGGKPILWHIMKSYSIHGINDFIICCGYKGYLIKEYFANYLKHRSDFTVDLKTGRFECLNESGIEDWKVTMVDTGENTQTAGRLSKVKKYIKGEKFCFTYGDGVGDIDIRKSIEQHESSGNHVTLTAVQPPGRFGALKLENDRVTRFKEKLDGENSWINGGYFIVNKHIINLITKDDQKWETDILPSIAKNNKLGAFLHKDFWHPMDTLRDKRYLESLWHSGQAPWKKW